MQQTEQPTAWQLEKIDSICDAYESLWRSESQAPSISTFLRAAPEELRSRLAAELWLLDRELREETTFFIPPEGQDGRGDHCSEQPGTTAGNSLIQCDALRGLSFTAKAALYDALEHHELQANQVLIREGQASSGLWVIQSGRLKICKGGQDEEVYLIDRAGPGSIVGEMSLLTQEPCTAHVITETPTNALCISGESYRDLVRQHPELEIAISNLVSDRLGSHTRDALCGRVLCGYRLNRCLARGGMGVVYLGHHVDEPEHPVAIKMLRHRFLYEPEAIEHFDRETEVLRQLKHTNIVSVRGHFVSLRTRFLVMDYFQGHDLRELLRSRGSMSETETLALVRQLVDALKFAHQQGVVHLDIKPENVLVGAKGNAVLTDFGLCQRLSQPDQTATIKGTPAYMAPEQFACEGIDERADWYALGCLIFEMLTGEQLFKRVHTVSELNRRLQGVPIEQLSHASISEPLRRLLGGLLEPNPSDRREPNLDIEGCR